MLNLGRCLEALSASESGGIAATREEIEVERDAVIAAARELLSEPTNVQALALARLMRDRSAGVRIIPSPFDLPPGYWLAQFGDGFTCGIAPDGSVSS